ncbi:sigma-70 family RNA polymerase sigma factor [Moorena producens JHB]|uniref:Sigma-70 family RNA polymerase sigma factor n=1 Tax=Moorena producens (strain JHB) TaxID=1454205 RepID=A0A1D9FUQ0_MOOP1|nr:sigma-70 family RNA polymerase sigma factor [Moorena producens]AOY79108.2 sigma-70 family RNA polymerase sigma factor [Moorena producens JHB]
MMRSDIQLEAISTGLGQSHHVSEKEFWQQWQQYQNYLYHRCLRWMGGNPTDAEDALSRAMIKAWEKVQKFGRKIANFKAWLTKLTHNLCVDIHREHCRSANHVENIEGIPEEHGLLSCDDTPERGLETDEKKIAIRRAIDNLPPRLHQTFILHFYQELSYREIAQQQEISYQNVCKRISQARAMLREELRGYFIGDNETGQDSSVTPTNEATESANEKKSQGNTEVEPIVGETVTSSVAVEEVESVVSEEVQEVVLSVQHSESLPVAATSEETLEVNNEALLRGGINMSGVGILPVSIFGWARCPPHQAHSTPDAHPTQNACFTPDAYSTPNAHSTKLLKSSPIYPNYHSYEVHNFRILGNREQGTGNREEVITNSDALHPNKESKSKNTVPHSYEVHRIFSLLPLASCLLPLASCLLPAPYEYKNCYIKKANSKNS